MIGKPIASSEQLPLTRRRGLTQRRELCAWNDRRARDQRQVRPPDASYSQTTIAQPTSSEPSPVGAYQVVEHRRVGCAEAEAEQQTGPVVVVCHEVGGARIVDGVCDASGCGIVESSFFQKVGSRTKTGGRAPRRVYGAGRSRSHP